MAAWDLPDGPVTIMFTDVEGSTALHTRLGDDDARALLRHTETTIRSALEAHGGHEVKGTGDGHLLWFASARRAVACAVAIQRALVGADVRIRIGLSSGEVGAEDGDLYGEAVNLAARVAARADGGEILVAEVVRQLTGTLGDATYREKGRFKLKGFPERVRLFLVDWSEPDAAPGPRLAMVGRDAELAQVRSVLDRMGAGRGGVVLVEGEAGIGKSRLVEEAMLIAERRGATVLRGAAADLDRTQPFRAIADALGAVRGSQDPLRRRIAELLRTGSTEASGYLIEQTCLELTEQLALASPVVLVVEDVHWADPSTLQVLRSLAPSAGDLPLVLLATLRPTPRSPELQHLLDRLRAEGADDVRLGPIAEEEQRALAAQVAGLSASDGVDALDAELAKTAGNPLYVIELARAAGSGDPVTSLSTLRATILSRLSHLPPETVEALRLAAVLGSAFSLMDLAAAAGRTAVSLVPVLREALAAQVLLETPVGLSFRHDLIRESLYEDLPATVRKALHAEIGWALARAGADAGLVAAHLAKGVAVGDEEAVAWIARAAREASRRSLTSGIELLEQALGLCRRTDALHDELEAELVVTLAWAGRQGEAIERAKTALARHPGRAGGFVIRAALAEAYLATARPHLANELGREGLELGASGLDRARFLILAAYGIPTEEAAAMGREARELAAAEGDDTLVGAALIVEAFRSSFAGDWPTLDRHLELAIEAFRRAATPAAARYQLQALAWRAWLLEVNEREEEGARIRREARRQAEELGATAMLNTFDVDDAMAHYRAGRLRDARALLDGVIARQDERGAGGPEGLGWAAQLAILLGDPDVPHLIERVRPLPEFWPLVEALQAQASGDHDRVVEVLLATFDDIQGKGWSWPVEIASPMLVRAAVAAGRVTDVERVVQDAEAAATSPAPTTGAEAMAMWCRALVDRDAGRLRQAIADPVTASRPLDRAHALEDVGDIHVEQGSSAEAVAAYQEALAIAEELDLAPQAARLGSKLRDLGTRAGIRGRRARPKFGWDSITPSEQAVIDLVAKGLTNPQISKQLFVSRHTVDSHLKHVYAKLGMSSRVELAAEVVRRS